MKQSFIRWYEKNEYLKAFMYLMQDLPPEEQYELAIDIIIKSSSLTDRDYTKLIREISDFNPKGFKRWYDKNPNIHVAIESLRDLTEEQREEVVREFTDKIIESSKVKLEDVET